MSGWQTVSVEIIDQEEVEKQRLLEEIRITAELNAIKEKERLEMVSQYDTYLSKNLESDLYSINCVYS